jgi:hypothetical protein
MIVIMCGDRNWNDFKIIDAVLSILPPNTEIVEGNCRGVDKISGYLARKRGMIVHVESADWNKYKKGAGPIRNQEMLNKYKIDLVIAFHNDIEKSKGTMDMITRATKTGILVKLVTSNTKIFI